MTVYQKAPDHTGGPAPSHEPSPAPGGQPRRYLYGRVVNKFIYCLLALFLGCIGMHRFYAGQTLSGLLRLVFFWTGVPALLGLLDCLAALRQPADGTGNICIPQ